MKKGIYYILTILGFILAAVGLIYLRTFGEGQGIMQVLPYILVGIGCGAFGHGLGEIISKQSMKNSPEIEKQLEIEKKR